MFAIVVFCVEFVDELITLGLGGSLGGVFLLVNSEFRVGRTLDILYSNHLQNRKLRPHLLFK